MSMECDVQDVIRVFVDWGDIEEETAVHLYVGIVNALQWGVEGVDVNSPDWEEQEYNLAYKELFGELDD